MPENPEVASDSLPMVMSIGSQQGCAVLLASVNTWSDTAPAGGKYKTNSLGVDKITASNTDQLYSVIATLYKKVNGGTEVSGSVSAFTNFKPRLVFKRPINSSKLLWHFTTTLPYIRASFHLDAIRILSSHPRTYGGRHYL